MKRDTQYHFGIGLAVLSCMIVGGVVLLQFVMGLQPCKLCLEQRYAYYFAIPIGFALSQSGKRVALSIWLQVSLTGVFFANTLLASYHAGVEWGFWNGPNSCSGTIGNFGDARDIFNRLDSGGMVRCNEVQWPFPILGLSLAGYNALVSLLLAGTVVINLIRQHSVKGASER